MVTSTTQPLKVLLVEDEPIVMRIHKRMLTDLGYAPDTAMTGKEALAMADSGYDVIFMDIGLPDINGIEVTTKIRQHEKGEKAAFIVALTAYTINEIQAACQEAGVDRIANKPVTAQILESFFLQYQALHPSP